MNRTSMLLLGVFVALAFSWTGVVLSSQRGYATLSPQIEQDDGKIYPGIIPGEVAQGRQVYQDLGCAYCHTQQIRLAGMGSDIGTAEQGGRGWGERQSVARDYLREQPVLMGYSRLGPDLRNFAARKNSEGGDITADWLYHYLYRPTLVVKNSGMPSYAFLFETRKIVGEPSNKALALTGDVAPAPGYEVVPTPRGESLVAYLLSLQDTYAYPETRNIYTPPANAEGGEAAKEDHS